MLKETYEAWAVKVMFDDHSSMLFPNDLENGALFDIDLLAKYAAWLDSLPDVEQQIFTLTNRVLASGLPLGCWCHPEPCHAHVLRDRVQAVIHANYCAVCGFPWGHQERCAACEAKPLLRQSANQEPPHANRN